MGFFKKLFNPYASDDEKELKDKTEEVPVKAEEAPVKVEEDSVKKTEEAPVREEPQPAPIEVKKEPETESTKPIEKPAKEDPKPASTPSITDIGMLNETLRELILEAVAPFTGGDDAFAGIMIWINGEFYRIVDTDPFKTTLRAAFDSMGLRSLGSGDIQIIHGEPTDADGATPLFKKGIVERGVIWFRLIDRQSVTPQGSRARITVLGGQGSLQQPEYVLDGGQKKIYRIGRGVLCRKPGAAYRVNDIVIEDGNPDENLQKINNFVSSAHADIIIEGGHFYLKATQWGCRSQGGSPTKIIRDQEPYELRDTKSAFALQDEDIIELGKSVLLKFSILGE